MKALRIIALILGAVWFFPVSCTTGLVVGTLTVARLDSRDVQKGEKPHRPFVVVALPGKDGRPFSVVPLKELPQFKKAFPDHSFLMKRPKDKVTMNRRIECFYTVRSNLGAAQTLEVVWKDDDKIVTSTYAATRDDVVPIFSQMFYQGYMFQALPFALVFAAVLLVLGRLLRKRLRRKAEESWGP